MSDPNAGDELAYVDAWEGRLSRPDPLGDELEEDETGQTTLGVPGEQRAIGGLASPRTGPKPDEETALEEAARLARVKR